MRLEISRNKRVVKRINIGNYIFPTGEAMETNPCLILS